jgi:methylated-DNA-[protein]-cysteine S-methyltransferase
MPGDETEPPTAALVDRAQEAPAGAATTAIAVLDGPLGPVRVAVTARAVVALELRSTDDAFVAHLVRRTHRDPIAGSRAGAARRALIDRLARRLDRFWAGEPERLSLPIDLWGLSAWDRRVLEAVRSVPWGRVTSYGRVATAIGAHGAARATGGAVGRNPIGLIVPCHRVIAGDGTLGGYGGSWFGTREELLELKRELLTLEGTALPAAALAMPGEDG